MTASDTIPCEKGTVSFCLRTYRQGNKSVHIYVHITKCMDTLLVPNLRHFILIPILCNDILLFLVILGVIQLVILIPKKEVSFPASLWISNASLWTWSIPLFDVQTRLGYFCAGLRFSGRSYRYSGLNTPPSAGSHVPGCQPAHQVAICCYIKILAFFLKKKTIITLRPWRFLNMESFPYVNKLASCETIFDT